jgi:type VI protein secretion system component Hcp
MADQPKSEMFMQFVTKDGDALLAECAADKDKDDDWMKDFNPEDAQNYSDFFEVAKFEFGVAIKPEDTSKSDAQTHKPQQHGGNTKKDAQHAKAKDAWQSWRSANSDSDVDNLKYPFEVDKFQFERVIDRASVELFTACCTSQTFKSAVFVKRVSTGGTRPGRAFLRIDFDEVMVTSLNWDDGDMLNETCEFICRGFKFKYRRQAADGSFLETVSADWYYKRDPLGKKGGR